jgi:tetratricopeptide (TPR) repeat protein
MGRKKALIIAVSKYDNDYPLKYCEKDGIEVYKLLSSPQLEYEIEKKNKLIGRVKSEEMKDAIVDFFQNEDVKPEDMLLFYYSGHGIPEGVNTYLSPSEIDPKLPIKRGFSFKDLRTVVEDPKSVSGTKVVILDCCHSGEVEIGKGEIDNSMQLITSIEKDSKALEQGEGICILAASQPYQGAYPLEEQGHSIFTYYLLEGLRDNEESVDSNGNVTPYSLNRYISKKINSLPAEKRPRQKPLMRSATSGEIILASYPKKPPPPIMPIPNSPTKSSEVEVPKGILASKSKILIGVGIAAVVAVVLTLALFNQPQQTLLNNRNALNKNILYHTGDDLFGQGNYTGAITYLDQALKIDPNNTDALIDKGEALDYLGNYTQAIQILDNDLAIKPNDESALNDRGYALNGLVY